MTVREAAELIGCNLRHIRTLISAGKLRARKVPTPLTRVGYYYQITLREAKRYRDTPQSQGWPRGEPRN